MDFINHWSERGGFAKRQLLDWLGVSSSRYYDWSQRYGKVNEHNRWVPRDHWLEDWEKRVILRYHEQHPLEGYRRLTYMMIDADEVAVSASSVYRVLRGAGVLDTWNPKPSKKGTGFVQPLEVHQHWHIDISYVNLGGTFYYLCSILDGCSRFIVHWSLGASMSEADVELIVQQALEKHPGVSPRMISDNGPQFIAKDFKAFIRLSGISHVRTSPYYPQSNGKLERYHRTIKSGCIRNESLTSLEQAQQKIRAFVSYYNEQRLHSAIGYVTPAIRLAGQQKEVFEAREKKLAQAREARREKRLNEKPSQRLQAAVA